MNTLKEFGLSLITTTLYGVPMTNIANKVRYNQQLTPAEQNLLKSYNELVDEQAVGAIDRQIEMHVKSIGNLLEQKARYLPALTVGKTKRKL